MGGGGWGGVEAGEIGVPARCKTVAVLSRTPGGRSLLSIPYRTALGLSGNRCHLTDSYAENAMPLVEDSWMLEPWVPPASSYWQNVTPVLGVYCTRQSSKHVSP